MRRLVLAVLLILALATVVVAAPRPKALALPTVPVTFRVVNMSGFPMHDASVAGVTFTDQGRTGDEGTVVLEAPLGVQIIDLAHPGYRGSMRLVYVESADQITQVVMYPETMDQAGER